MFSAVAERIIFCWRQFVKFVGEIIFDDADMSNKKMWKTFLSNWLGLFCYDNLTKCDTNSKF